MGVGFFSQTEYLLSLIPGNKITHVA